MRSALLLCGIVAALVYAAMNVFIPMLDPRYDVASQTVSELSAIGAPTRAIWMPFGFAYSLLVAAFGLGVLTSAGTSRRLRFVGRLFIADGVLAGTWPPMHVRGVETTLTDTLHIVWAGLAVVLMLLAIGVGGFALGKRFRIYSISTMVVLTACGALTASDAPRVPENLPTPWIGVWERLNILAFLVWIVVFAVILRRRARHGVIVGPL